MKTNRGAQMLIDKEKLRYDFNGATFDLNNPVERQLLAWIFNQFLYGEVTGIQCGHWLFHAPHLNAAAFIAKQAGEELAHVRKILRILSLLSEQPGPAHWAIRVLSTDMMGGFWGAHVALEMALGEGLVLSAFYAMTDTIPHPEIRKILESATLEEERHVEFGERETQRWLLQNPQYRPLLLGEALLQELVLSRLKKYVLKKVTHDYNNSSIPHSVLGQFEGFYEHTLKCFRLRIHKLGLSEKPVESFTLREKASLILMLPFRKLKARLSIKDKLLTSTYLSDPVLLAESERFADHNPPSNPTGTIEPVG